MPRTVFKFPTAITVIMIVALVAAAATWVIPAGQYNRLEYADSGFVMQTADRSYSLPATQATLDSLGIKTRLEKFVSGAIRKPVAVPGSYHRLEPNRQGLVSLVEAPIKGLYETVDIIFFILMIGGFISVFYASGAMEKGIRALVKSIHGRENHLILIFFVLFAAAGSSYGFAEEGLAFFPILVPVFLAAGYDLLIPVAILFLAPQIGTLASVSNPFSVIMASNVAGVNWTSGIIPRILLFVITVGVTLAYLIRYGNKVRRNPQLSLLYTLEGKLPQNSLAMSAGEEARPLGIVDKLVLLLFVSSFLLMVAGVVYLGWWLLEMSAVFLSSSVLLALITRMKEGVFVDRFISGARDLLGVAFIVGLARGVTILLNEGRISDTILYYAAGWVNPLPSGWFLVAILLVFLMLTLFISSSSGMAVLTMPIISALGDMHGIDGNQTVDAYLLGMGVMGIITPTGLALPSLAMVNVSYKTWIRFMLPLMGMLLGISIIYQLVTLWW